MFTSAIIQRERTPPFEPYIEKESLTFWTVWFSCTYNYVYIYIFTHTHAHTRTSMYTIILIEKKHAPPFEYTYSHIHTHTHVPLCTHLYFWKERAHHLLNIWVFHHDIRQRTSIHMWIYIYICMYSHESVYICMYIYVPFEYLGFLPRYTATFGYRAASALSVYTSPAV